MVMLTTDQIGTATKESGTTSFYRGDRDSTQQDDL